jgi:quercetin dioxygenase-like cupin family protein
LKIDQSDGRLMRRPPESAFVGEVKIGGYFRRDVPSRLAGAIVHFAPGSRTPWKINPLGQTLVILSGTGIFQNAGEDPVEVRCGDVIWCAPGEKHWEGASPDEAMSYFAIQEEDGSRMVSFERAVSDEEYAFSRS